MAGTEHNQLSEPSEPSELGGQRSTQSRELTAGRSGGQPNELGGQPSRQSRQEPREPSREPSREPREPSTAGGLRHEPREESRQSRGLTGGHSTGGHRGGQLREPSKLGREGREPSEGREGRERHPFREISRLSGYTVLKQLGQGTFGVVYKARSRANSHLVAMKMILEHKGADGFPTTAYREILALKRLRNVNLVELVDIVHDFPPELGTPAARTPAPDAKRAYFMVFPYMSYDLTGVLSNPDVRLQPSDIKSVMVQMLRGVGFLHAQHYLHRDIKASNILINHEGVLKIGDFGLARKYGGPVPTHDAPGGGVQELTEVVMTRWYRAPEVMFGERRYTTAVDVWGVGCVFGELFEKKPILCGKSDLEQAYTVFDLVGSPTEDSFPGLGRYLKHRDMLIKDVKGNIDQRFSRLGPDGLDLLKQLLTLDPYRRITVARALQHPYFHAEPLPTDRIRTDFPECHEADAARFKELAKKRQGPQAPQGPQDAPRRPGPPQQARTQQARPPQDRPQHTHPRYHRNAPGPRPRPQHSQPYVQPHTYYPQTQQHVPQAHYGTGRSYNKNYSAHGAHNYSTPSTHSTPAGNYNAPAGSYNRNRYHPYQAHPPHQAHPHQPYKRAPPKQSDPNDRNNQVNDSY